MSASLNVHEPVSPSVDKIVDVPVLEFQEGFAEQIVGFTVPAIREELVEAIQSLPQDCVQGRFAEQILDFAVSCN